VDLKTGVEVALKTMPQGSDDASIESKAAQQRWHNEVDAARRLDHPGIVRILAAGKSRDLAWIAMELVEGTDLSYYTRAETLLPLADVIDIGLRLCDALAHAHASGVVHRDLKPANVLIDRRRDIVKLADFGVARLHDAVRTRTGLMPGSPAYMAPEQLAGDEVGPSSDIYALGAMLFELIGARPPFAAPSLGEMMQHVARHAAPDLRDLRPEVPAMLAETVARALAKQPRLRPVDANELARLLQRAGRELSAETN
jgi:serine/threonine-protein kinase